MKLFNLFLLLLCAALSSKAQLDTGFIYKIKSLDTANILKKDTMAVPNDRLTKKIKLLRKERGSFNIETIVKIKLAEEQKDTSHSKEFYSKLQKEVTTGRTATLLENSVINLYRREFTETEIDQLIAFYKTPVGKKMSKEFILLMVESAKDAEQLMKMAFNHLDNKTK